MTLYYENEVEEKFDFDAEAVANQVIEETLNYESFPYDVLVELNLVNNEIIQEMNQEYRGIDRATDVLSFPMLDYDTAGDYTALEIDEGSIDPETELLMLGNIVISVDKMKEQAEEYNHSLLREYAFLIVHSMLHLLGYDHEEQTEEQEMFRRQDEILNRCKITREC